MLTTEVVNIATRGRKFATVAIDTATKKTIEVLIAAEAIVMEVSIATMVRVTAMGLEVTVKKVMSIETMCHLRLKRAIICRKVCEK